MIMNPFCCTDNKTMRTIYTAILAADKAGLRPKELDPYIETVLRDLHDPENSYRIAWKLTEKYFYEEVARRFFHESLKDVYGHYSQIPAEVERCK